MIVAEPPSMKLMPGPSVENPIGGALKGHAAVLLGGVLLMLASGGAAVLATWHIHSASIDVAYSDTWRHMPLIEHFLGGSLDPSEIFAPSNQNRPALLKVWLLISTAYDHLNLKRMEYLSILSIAATIWVLASFSSPLFSNRRAVYFSIFSCISIL